MATAITPKHANSLLPGSQVTRDAATHHTENSYTRVVVTDITGETGLKLVRDMRGRRARPERLAAHRNYRCHAGQIKNNTAPPLPLIAATDRPADITSEC
jgi:hypothetical protein